MAWVMNFISIGLLALVTTPFTLPSVTSDSLGNDQLSVSNTHYYLQMYNMINNFRSRHVAPALKWNRTLNENAEALALDIVTSHTSIPDPEDYEGVNYYEVAGARPTSSLVVNTWYNESSLYNYNSPGYGINYLNFTQMIWKSSSAVGIGVASFNGNTVVVARFTPPGNLRGKFRTNVIAVRKTR